MDPSTNQAANEATLDGVIAALLDRCRSKLGDDACTMVQTAIELGRACHQHQVRKLDQSPYFFHPLTVANYCLDWGLIDQEALCAAVLHDVIEDAPPELEAETRIAAISPEVASLVLALSKIRDMQTGDGDVPATYRRILSAAAKDLRVLLIKMFDVLHNSETLEVHTPEKAQGKAGLGLIYVGVARRLGILELADRLIERILPHLMPIRYKQAYSALRTLQNQSRDGIQHLIDGPLQRLICPQGRALAFELDERQLGDFFFLTDNPGSGRLNRVGLPVFRLRLVVEDDETAWWVIGQLHSHFDPLPRHIRDYLNVPRINGFRALTTRILWEGQPVSVHVVRQQDLGANRRGILSDWGHSGPDPQRYMRLLATLGDSDLRMSEVHAHVLPDTLDIYTPKGDRFTFPVGSVVVDFAYMIHTELGEKCIGAKINGVAQDPEFPLEDGDVVFVLTSRNARPQRSWLDVAKTARARTLIKQALKDPALPVQGLERLPNKAFQVTSLTGPDLLWSVCCLPTPLDPILGQPSADDNGRWELHRTDCAKVTGEGWNQGSWRFRPMAHPILNVTFTLVHRAGALLAVLELLAKHGINSHAVQGKGHSADIFTINMELGDKPPTTLGHVLKELVKVPSVQEIQHFYWRHA